MDQHFGVKVTWSLPWRTWIYAMNPWYMANLKTNGTHGWLGAEGRYRCCWIICIPIDGKLQLTQPGSEQSIRVLVVKWKITILDSGGGISNTTIQVSSLKQVGWKNLQVLSNTLSVLASFLPHHTATSHTGVWPKKMMILGIASQTHYAHEAAAEQNQGVVEFHPGN